MATISVPLSPEQHERLDTFVAEGVGASRADIMRRAFDRFSEEEAVNAVLRAELEPTLHGNMNDLLKKIV